MKSSGLLREHGKVAALVLAFFFSGGLGTAPAGAEEISVYGTVEHFLWKEFGAGNTRFLEESGLIAGVGFSYDKEWPNHVTVKPAAEIFSGRVDYDGSTQSGIPTTSTVDYLGINFKGDVGGRLGVTESMYIEPFAGLGIRVWNRDINNGTTTSGQPVQGYTERWTSVALRLGVRTGVNASPTVRYYGEAGLKLPLYNQNYVYLSDIGGSDVTLNPGKQASLFAEAGMKLERLRAGLFYEGLRFSRSDYVSIGGGQYVYQPESMADIFGLNIGVVF